MSLVHKKLELVGAHAGKTITLNGVLFTDGVARVAEDKTRIDNLCRYFNKAYQCSVSDLEEESEVEDYSDLEIEGEEDGSVSLPEDSGNTKTPVVDSPTEPEESDSDNESDDDESDDESDTAF